MIPEATYTTYRTKAIAVAYAILHHRQDAEDAVQEAFRRAVAARDKFQGGSAPETFLHRVVTNVALDALRSRRAQHWPHEPLDAAEWLPTRERSAEALCIEAELVERALAAVEGTVMREPVMAVLEDRYRPSSDATSTSKVRFLRAKRYLREVLA